ncbi:MAG: hypothetical protein ACREYE_01565 [Gammaproteobacteria bacterium]
MDDQTLPQVRTQNQGLNQVVAQTRRDAGLVFTAFIPARAAGLVLPVFNLLSFFIEYVHEGIVITVTEAV